MASTFSDNLRLELIGTGDQSGAWGDTTNTNLGDLLEQAISGVESIAHDDTDTFTLTTNDGALDQARNMVLVITGVLTADRPVIVPSVDKFYVVRNATTGGFTLNVAPAGGTSVAVLPNTVTTLYTDGTNANLAVDFSEVVITGGTIDGTVIGGTTPAAGNFTTLGASGLTTLESNIVLSGNIFRPDATGVMELSGGSATNLGANITLYGETEASDPSDIRIRAGTDLLLRWDESADYWSAPKNFRFSDAVEAQFGADADLRVYNTGSAGFIINNTGVLAIDTRETSTVSFLRAADSTDTIRNVIGWGGATTGAQLYHQGDLVFQTDTLGALVTHGSTPRLYVNDETGTATSINAQVQFNYAGTGNVAGYAGFIASDDMYFDNQTAAGNNYYTTAFASGFHFFQIGGIEIARVRNNGIRMADNYQYVVGTSDDLSLTHTGGSSFIQNQTGNLFVDNNATTGSSILLRAKDAGGTIRSGILLSGGNSDPFVRLYQGASAERLRTTSAGGTLTGTWTATGDLVAFSDITMKPDWSDIGADEAIRILKTWVGGRWTDEDGRAHIGVNAQNIEQEAPELVHDHDGTKGVAYGNTVGVLIPAIKAILKKLDM